MRTVFCLVVCITATISFLTVTIQAQNTTDMFDAATEEKLEGAHAFELSYRARGSVADDPFYTVPAGTADAAPGTLLKVERDTNQSLYTLAPNLSLSRFMYQSRNANGTLVPVSGYILWPYIATRKHPSIDGYPTIVWAHGTSGTNDECAPSNIQNLWHHFQAPYQIALNGYVVVATDYAGLGVGTDANGNPIAHEYLTAPAQANDVLYSFVAARSAFPELSKEYVILGSSLGGAASWSCAEKLACEKLPAELVTGYRGTVTLSPVVNVMELPKTEGVFPLLMVMLLPGLIARYPGFDASEVLTPDGVKAFNAYVELKGCNTVLFNLPINASDIKPGFEDNPVIQDYQKIAAVGGRPFAGPMLVMTGGADPIVYPPTVTQAVEDTIQKVPDAQLEYYLLPDVSHAPAMYSGWQVYLDWIRDRFDGISAPKGYQNNSDSIKPIRPASVQQIEANWFIQNFTSSTQLT